MWLVLSVRTIITYPLLHRLSKINQILKVRSLHLNDKVSLNSKLIIAESMARDFCSRASVGEVKRLKRKFDSFKASSQSFKSVVLDLKTLFQKFACPFICHDHELVELELNSRIYMHCNARCRHFQLYGAIFIVDRNKTETGDIDLRNFKGLHLQLYKKVNYRNTPKSAEQSQTRLRLTLNGLANTSFNHKSFRPSFKFISSTYRPVRSSKIRIIWMNRLLWM